MTNEQFAKILPFLQSHERGEQVERALRNATLDPNARNYWAIVDDYAKDSNRVRYFQQMIRRIDISLPEDFMALAAGLGMTVDNLRRLMEAEE